MFPAPWLTGQHRLAIQQCHLAIATCPDSLHFAPWAPRPRIALCQPATTVRQLCRWMDHLPGLKRLSLRESPLSYNFNRARGLLANALLPLVLQGVSMRRLYRLDVLRIHLHGGDGEKLWTPMHDLLTMLQEYPLVAWHPTIQDLGPVLRNHPLQVELVLAAAPSREHDWTEMTARAEAIEATMRPDAGADGSSPWAGSAAVLAPGDEASLCPMVDAHTVTVARTRVEHQNIEHDRLLALQRRHEYIYGPSPRVIVANLEGLPHPHHDDDDNDEPEPLEEELARMLMDSPSPSPPRSGSSTPELEESFLGGAVAFCYPSLVEFTHWQMMSQVQQLMERFKAHHRPSCVPRVELERPLVTCQGACPVAAATWIPASDDLTTTILPVVDRALLASLRRELATEPCGYQLAVFQTQSPVDPPSFLCHCQPPPPPPPP